MVASSSAGFTPVSYTHLDVYKRQDLLCDNVLRAKPQIEQDIAELLDNCDEYEIRMVRDMTRALLETLRRDANFRS